MTNKMIKRKNWVEFPGDEAATKMVSEKYNLSPLVAKTILNRCGEDYESYIWIPLKKD